MSDDRRHRIDRRHGDRRTPEARIYILPIWIRIWHWSNATLILALIATGISLHFAGSNARLIEFSLAVYIHNIAGVLLVLLYLFFVIANIITGNWWQFVPRPPGILEHCYRQTRFYLWGVFKGEHEPYPVTREENFNALQAITYWVIIYMVMPLLIGSGLIFMYPQFAPVGLFGVDGLLGIAVLHYLSACLVLAFLIAHVYLCTFGKKISSTFKTMITGWHEH